MTATLPLFSDLAESAGAQPAAARAVVGGAEGGERHLHAAWRLSRAMRRYRAGSAEETRAGLAICHHLQALLRQTPVTSPSGSEPSGRPSGAPPVRSTPL